MPEIHLIDHFTYYTGEPHQKEAIQLLQVAMPDSLLKKKCQWVSEAGVRQDEPWRGGAG